MDGFMRLGTGLELAGPCKCKDELSGSIKCGNSLTSLGIITFSIRTLLQAVSNLSL
jgi:hypothetical protein